VADLDINGAMELDAGHFAAGELPPDMDIVDRVAGNGAEGSAQSRAQPGAVLLLECQGRRDLAHCTALARKLGAKVRCHGGEFNAATEADAIGAGALALTRWRNGEAVDGGGIGAGAVAWRAIVASVARDHYGEQVAFDWFTPEALAGSALPLPGTYETRQDAATRLRFERTRAQRPARLAKRIEYLASMGGRGRRRELVERVGRALLLLLHGADLDSAATGAGFKASGDGRHKVRAGDMLARAVRRLGFKFQFDLRLKTGERRQRG